MKYRKKPVIVEAYQTDREMVIHTLEGDMTASPGDYIITGIEGEQYPCKPEIFGRIYEPVAMNYDAVLNNLEIAANRRKEMETVKAIEAKYTAYYDGAYDAIKAVKAAQEREEKMDIYRSMGPGCMGAIGHDNPL